MMAVSIPPHNLDEIIKATIHLIEHPEASTQDLLRFIKGPDFPSGCAVVNQEDFLGIYQKGKGSFILRANFEFTGNILVIKNLPMYSIAAKIEGQIYQAKQEGFFKEIMKVVNTTAQSQQLTIQLKSKYDADELVRALCKMTDAERSMHLDLRAVDKGKPQAYTILSYLRRWIDIHVKLNKKELQLILDEVNYKLEVTEGLRKALLHIDEIITLIKASADKSAARQALQKIGFSEIQANAILDIKLSRLTKLEAVELDKQIVELKEKVDYLTELLTRPEVLKAYIIKNLQNFLGYDKPRLSVIENTKFPKIIKVKQEIYYATYAQGVVKVTETMPKTKHFIISTKTPLFLLSDTNVIPVKNNNDAVYANVHGILSDTDVFHFSTDGYVKRTKPEEFQVARKAKAVNQKEVHTVLQTNEGYALLTTKTGKQVQFDLAEVPYSKRGAKGVIAAKLENEKIEKIELIKAPLKGVTTGRNKHVK